MFPDSYSSIYELGTHRKVFQKQLHYITDHYKVISLKTLWGKWADHGKDNLAVITFDDGYLDNYQVAFPVLRQFKVPATIFVVSGLVGTADNLWNDLLVNYLEDQNSRQAMTFEPFEGTFCIATFRDKQETFYRLKELVKYLPRNRKDEFIGKLVDHNHPEDRIMDWSQLRELVASGIVDIGAHTVTHELLTRVTRDEAKKQVRNSKLQLEEGLGCPVHSFAYPNGDYDASIAEMVRDSGYSGACTTRTGVSNLKENCFELSRKGTDRAVWGSPWGEFSKALFAVEMSGLFDWLFERN